MLPLHRHEQPPRQQFHWEYVAWCEEIDRLWDEHMERLVVADEELTPFGITVREFNEITARMEMLEYFYERWKKIRNRERRGRNAWNDEKEAKFKAAKNAYMQCRRATFKELAKVEESRVESST